MNFAAACATHANYDIMSGCHIVLDGIHAKIPRISTPSSGRDKPTHKWTFWGDQCQSYHLQAMHSLYSWSACSQLHKDHGQIWNESSHGRGLISTTDYRSTVTSLILCNSYTIQYLTFHLFTHHHFCFQSGPTEDLITMPYLQFGRTSSCQCDATVGIGSSGFSHSQGLRCAGDGHSITYKICMLFFYASSLSHSLVCACFDSLGTNNWGDWDSRACGDQSFHQ